MLPQIPIIRLADSLDLPLPRYADGVGTSIILQAAVSEPIKIIGGQFITIPTGFACALPLGVEAQVRSLKESKNSGLVVLNAPLTIDASDREEITVTLFNAGHNAAIIRRGQPIALLVFQAALRIQWDEITAQDVLKRERELLMEQEEAYQEQEEKQSTEENKTENVTEILSPEITDTKNDTDTLTKEDEKEIQTEVNNEFNKLEEINIQNIPDVYSEQALLEETSSLSSVSKGKTEIIEETPSSETAIFDVKPEIKYPSAIENAQNNDSQSPVTFVVDSQNTSLNTSIVEGKETSASEETIEAQLQTALQNLPTSSDISSIEAPAFIAEMPEVTAPVIPPMQQEVSEEISPSLDNSLPQEIKQEITSSALQEEEQKNSDFETPQISKVEE